MERNKQPDATISHDTKEPAKKDENKKKMRHWKGELTQGVMIDEMSWEKWYIASQKVIWAVVELAQLRYYSVFTWMRRSNWGGVRVGQNESGRNRKKVHLCGSQPSGPMICSCFPFLSVLDVRFCVHISPAMRLMVVRMKIDMFSYRGQQDTQTTQKGRKNKQSNNCILSTLETRLLLFSFVAVLQSPPSYTRAVCRLPSIDVVSCRFIFFLVQQCSAFVSVLRMCVWEKSLLPCRQCSRLGQQQ